MLKTIGSMQTSCLETNFVGTVSYGDCICGLINFDLEKGKTSTRIVEMWKYFEVCLVCHRTGSGMEENK